MDAKARHFDTIIIGAGISGLACAQRLFRHERWRQAGRLCVLEARDRIGGRIESVNVHGCRLDTGANWIHGIGTKEHPNPLMDILPDKLVSKLSGSVMSRPAEKLDVRNSDKSSRDEGNDWVTVSAPVPPATNPTMSTKDLVIPSEDATNLSSTMWATIGGLHEVAHEKSAAECKETTILDVISKMPSFRDAFKSTDPKYHHALRAMPQFVENIEAAPLYALTAERQKDKLGMSLLEYKIDDFDGDQVFLRDGYAAVAHEVGKDLIEAGLVHCGVDVEQIEWDASPIEITTSHGKYTADEVVCTIPLGVLKDRHQSLFEPTLPGEYQEAVDSLGFGTLDKIFVVYSHAWWAEEPYKSIIKKGISRSPINAEDADGNNSAEDEPDSFMGFTDALIGIEIGPDGDVGEGTRMLSMMNLHRLTGFPALSAFVSCANARQVEAMSDEEAGEMIHSELTAWFGQEPPEPQAVHVTRWAADPLSKGSYSHMIAGRSERKHREQFQQPLNGSNGGRLRFAGEHTSSERFATVHGALISGWDAAEAIMEARNLG